LAEAIEEGYAFALLLVAKETPLEIEDLPDVCPYSLEEAIDDIFFPD
jgi:Domain of unknown function DUF29